MSPSVPSCSLGAVGVIDLPGLVVVIQFDVGTWCENCTLLLVPYRQRVEDSAPFFVVFFFLRRDLQTKLSLIVIPVKLHTGEAVT